MPKLFTTAIAGTMTGLTKYHWLLKSLLEFICVTECIVCIQGYDSLTFSFLSSFLFFNWVGILWPQLSKVLKLVRWAGSVPFSPVSLQRQVVCLLLRPVFRWQQYVCVCERVYMCLKPLSLSLSLSLCMCVCACVCVCVCVCVCETLCVCMCTWVGVQEEGRMRETNIQHYKNVY